MSEKIVQTAGRNALGQFAPDFTVKVIHDKVRDDSHK